MEENLAIFQDRKMESSLILFIYKGLQRGCNSYYISRQVYIVLNHIFFGKLPHSLSSKFWVGDKKN